MADKLELYKEQSLGNYTEIFFRSHSCPILSHRVHPTKQRSICCRSEKFHLISEKWTKCCRFVRFVKWKSLLSIRQVRSSIGQLHLISDDGDPVKVLSIRSIRSICQMEKFPIDSTKCGRRSDNCISLVTTATR